MQLGPSSRAQISDGLIAAMTLLSEKPHQGVPTSTHTMYQGFGFVIANTALGMPPRLYDEGVGSRSTGKERDAESGNDYMFARYYNSATGRFLSPDWSAKYEPVPYAKLDDPQSLNLYAYVLNNPLNKMDPDGHCPGEGQQSSSSECAQVKVTAKVSETPSAQTNVPAGNGKQATGVGGRIQDTITEDGKPLPDVKVTETNKNTLTENGQKVPLTTVEGKAKSAGDGTVDDKITLMSVTDGTAKTNAAIMKDLNTNAYTLKSTQTITLGLPSGTTCTCSVTRTLTNVGSSGAGSSHYTLTTAQPTQPQ